MKNLSFLLTLCVSLLLLMSACSDDDDMQEWPGGTSAKLLPVKISGKVNGNQQVFEYDNDNRLTAEIYYTKSNGKTAKYSEFRIEYDSQGRIAKAVNQIVNGESNTYTFTYDGSKITILDTYYTNYIDIDAQGRILKKEQYYNTNQQLAVEYNYSYDQKGNVAIENLRSNTIYTYTYDSQNGIFSCINTPQWFIVSMLGRVGVIYNNYTELEISYPDDSYHISSKITYTYNKNGYPIKYIVPNNSGCGTPPLPETDFVVEYTAAK